MYFVTIKQFLEFLFSQFYFKDVFFFLQKLTFQKLIGPWALMWHLKDLPKSSKVIFILFLVEVSFQWWLKENYSPKSFS